MKATRALRSLILVAILCVSADASDLPEEYAPFEKMLGEWTGTVELEVSSPSGSRRIEYEKQAECTFDARRRAVVMIDTETDPWTKQEVTTTAEIRWDKESKSFKAMVHATDGSVRLFVIRKREGRLEYQQIDGAPGMKFHCEIMINKSGQIIESGQRSWASPRSTSMDWKVVYSPKTK